MCCAIQWEAGYADCLTLGGGALNTMPSETPLKTKRSHRYGLHSKTTSEEEHEHKEHEEDLKDTALSLGLHESALQQRGHWADRCGDVGAYRNIGDP